MELEKLHQELVDIAKESLENYSRIRQELADFRKYRALGDRLSEIVDGDETIIVKYVNNLLDVAVIEYVRLQSIYRENWGYVLGCLRGTAPVGDPEEAKAKHETAKKNTIKCAREVELSELDLYALMKKAGMPEEEAVECSTDFMGSLFGVYDVLKNRYELED